ncbi:penicillin-binding protein 2 [Azospirillum sp. 412522]|nr:penicillin-binding protein 2 [Azospirillum sp. 412522]
MSGNTVEWPEPSSQHHHPIKSRAEEALELSRRRLLVVAALTAATFGAIGVRAATVMLSPQELKQPTPSLAFRPRRADIVDRHGNVVATSLPVVSLSADPALIQQPEALVAGLLTILPDLSHEELLKDFRSSKRFVWVRRHLSPKLHQAVLRLGSPALSFVEDQWRAYPTSQLVSHIVGLSGSDGTGLRGIERTFNERLTTDPEALTLSIDLRIQHIVHRILKEAVEEFRAIGAGALVMDVNTGELLSLASLPDFNPNAPKDQNDPAYFNIMTLGTYEMGSVFKIFNSAMALDSGRIRMSDTFDPTKQIRIGSHVIHDDHPMKHPMSVAEIFQHSSNIGSIQIAMKMGIDAQREFLGRLGLLQKSPIELPEVGAPLLPRPWREVNSWTISYGHGIAVSPLQVATAAAAVINGGVLYPPTLIKQPPGGAPTGKRVLSPQASDAMRRLFRLVVTSGTGKLAGVPGYIVGGKTGTADKLKGGAYGKHSNLASFVGAFPMHNPRYLVMVTIDEPHGTAKTYGFATAGFTAAPVAGRIIREVGAVLGVPRANEDSPEIHKILDV